jgi:hypothetical protein
MGATNRRPRTLPRVVLSVISALFALPSLIFGGYLFLCWLRIRTSDVYYVDYSYGAAALMWTGFGLLGLAMTLYGILRRTYYGMLFAGPVLMGVAAMIVIPDSRPETVKSMTSDSNYLGDLGSFLNVWYGEHHAFPRDEVEFRQAMRNGPGALRGIASPVPASPYKQRWSTLPYKVVVLSNASGPRLTAASERPGIVYYCVSSDLQEFWATMTGLNSDVGGRASIKHVGDSPDYEYYVVHETRRDYPGAQP